jgi:hypothetical protein
MTNPNILITPPLEGDGQAVYVDGKFFITLDSCSIVMKYTVMVGTSITYTSFDEAEARRFAGAYVTAEIFAQLTIVTPLIEI